MADELISEWSLEVRFVQTRLVEVTIGNEKLVQGSSFEIKVATFEHGEGIGGGIRRHQLFTFTITELQVLADFKGRLSSSDGEAGKVGARTEPLLAALSITSRNSNSL
jgi:hypothetical protein